MSKIVEVYYEDDDLVFQLETYEGHPYIHCEVKSPWSKTLLRRCREVVVKLKDDVIVRGHEALYTYTDNVKWCKQIGEYEVIGNFYDSGKEYKVLEWQLVQ